MCPGSSGPGSMTTDGPVPTIQVFVPSSVNGPGLGAKSRTTLITPGFSQAGRTRTLTFLDVPARWSSSCFGDTAWNRTVLVTFTRAFATHDAVDALVLIRFVPL